MELLGSHWKDLDGILYLSIFRKSVEKIKVLLKSYNNDGYFTRRSVCIFDHISLNSSYSGKYLGQICRQNQSIHFIFQ